jgi:hypothetical protein
MLKYRIVQEELGGIRKILYEELNEKKMSIPNL